MLRVDSYPVHVHLVLPTVLRVRSAIHRQPYVHLRRRDSNGMGVAALGELCFCTRRPCLGGVECFMAEHARREELRVLQCGYVLHNLQAHNVFSVGPFIVAKHMVVWAMTSDEQRAFPFILAHLCARISSHPGSSGYN